MNYLPYLCISFYVVWSQVLSKTRTRTADSKRANIDNAMLDVRPRLRFDRPQLCFIKT